MAGLFGQGRGEKSNAWAHAGKLPTRIEAILAMLRDRRPVQEVCVAILAAGIELLGTPKELAFVRYCDCTTGATRRIITIDNAYADSVLADTLRGITGRALRTGKPQLVGEVRKDRDYVVLANQARSELAVPLLLGGACYGVLNFESPRRNAFGASQIPWVQLLAQLAALAERFDIERGPHDSELLRGGTRDADSAYLRGLDATLDRVIATLGGDPDLMAEAMMIVPHSQQLVTLRLRPNSSSAMHIRLRAGEGIAGRALQLGQPFSGDTQLDSPEKRGRPIGEITHLHNTRSALAVPLRAKDDTIVGLLNVESPRAGAFGQDALDALDRSGLLADLANRLAPLQRETLTPETVADDLLDTLEQQIAFAIDPDDLSGTYYQILQVAARIVSAPEVSAGLILVRDEALNLVGAKPGDQRKDYWAVRASRLGLFDSDLEWRMDGTSIARRVMDTGQTANVPDVRKDPDYRDSGTGYDESSELIAA
ncbi:MAG TPA: GAF domain-containing protein, partial [Ktedonobacterales bacterium]|nr:GAF domain-containing protein [Ktedonobacterales bacterium]